MDIMELQKLNNEECPRLRKEMVEAVKVYRDTMLNPDSTRDEIKDACNEAILKMVAVIDLQTELVNNLIVAGRLLGEKATGKQPKPKS